MKRALAISYFLAIPTLATAQSIESGFNSMANWLVGIGMAVAAVFLVVSGIKITSGKQEGKEHAAAVFIGSIVILCSGGVIGLIRGWFH
jgi:hypothetical protein